MGSRMLETIRRIRVRLCASLHWAYVWLLAGMRTRMDFQIFGTRETLVALLTLVWLFFGVRPYVHQHFVACIEAAIGTRTNVPLAVV